MPNFDAGRFSGKTLEDVFDYLARFDRQLDYLLNGQLDSHNAFEFGGWRVNDDSLKSLSNNVGMSSAGTISSSIRFWAGNAVLGSAPFRVTEAGALFASNATITGSVTATSGAIGGWVIGATSLTDAAAVVGLSSAVTGANDIRIWAGNVTPGSAAFRVYEDGTMYATNGNFTGAITGSTITSGSSINIATDATIGNNLTVGFGASNRSIVLGAAVLNYTAGNLSVGGPITMSLDTLGNLTLNAIGGNLGATSTAGTITDIVTTINGKVTSGATTSATAVSDSHNHGLAGTDYIQCYDGAGVPTALKLWVPYAGSASHTHTVS